MLVLTRKLDEEVVIGDKDDRIIIRILKVQGGKVSIGIQANKKWQIVRKELLTNEPTDLDLPFDESEEAKEKQMELVGSDVS